MNSPEERWWSIRAGEYVLGTLRGEDLALFERILAHDTDMRLEVGRWERRLTGLNETTLAREPAAHVWPQLLERVRHTAASDERADGEPAATVDPREASPATGSRSPGPRPARVRSVESRPDAAPAVASVPARGRWWPAVAGLATAASLVLGLLLGLVLYQEGGLTGAPDGGALSVDGLAVVLSDENGQPYFLVETDYGNLRVRVTALTPPSIEGGRNFQLWQALPDRSAVRPVALLPRETGVAQTFDVGSLIEGSDLFGVSIEPEGAPTDSGPTGPVVAHGDFLPRRDRGTIEE